MKKLTNIINLIVIFILFFTIIGCGGGDGSSDSIVIKEGQFLDSAVSGLQYSSGNQSGVTDPNGTFKFEEGKTIKFFIGDIILGEANGKSIITPVDLVLNGTVSDQEVINISRFLLTLDFDKDPNNGILIPAEAQTKATGISIEFNVSEEAFEDCNIVDTFISQVANTSNLISSNFAQGHLQQTLSIIIFNNFVGCWQGSGTFIAENETYSKDSKLSFSIEGNALIVTFDIDDNPVSIPGTLIDGVFTFNVPNSDPADPDCANWDVVGTATLNTALTTMSLQLNGIFCGMGGGKQGTFFASLTKDEETIPSVDYSIYSGEWDWTFTTSKSKDESGVGETRTDTIMLNITSDGNVTFPIHPENTYCGTGTASGRFNGNSLTISTNQDYWNCNGTPCCNGQDIGTLTFSDKDHATGSMKFYSCCSDYWKESSITAKRNTEKDNPTSAYYEIYGAQAGDYNLTKIGHQLIGTSNSGNTFDLSIIMLMHCLSYSY